MKRYPKYINTGIIGEVPSTWKSTKLKYLGFLYGGLTGKSGDDFRKDDDPNNRLFIPFTNISNNVYISTTDLKHVYIKEGEVQNSVKKGDLFFLMSSETSEDIGKSSVLKDDLKEVYLNSFCKGFRLTDATVDPLFLNYLLRGYPYRQVLSIEGNGFTRINLRQDRVSDFMVYIPIDKEEQHAIVSFLDTKTSQIDALISNSERKIELLKEKRTALINHVVTKGLDPNVKMKDSGVEWIGEIPENCNINKLNRVSTKIGDGLHGTPVYSVGTAQYFINGNNIRNGQIVFIDSTKEVDMSEFQKHYIELYTNKTLLISINGTIGSIAFYKGEKVILGKSVCYVNLKKDAANLNYLFYYLSSHNCQSHFLFESTGTTIFNLSLGSIRDLKVILPTSEEQEEIVKYLDHHTSEIDKKVSLEERRIELLKEYRQSLISEVVTGKINVLDYAN